MRLEDVKCRMKVVPHAKSIGYPFDTSEVWRQVKNDPDPFLYVTAINQFETGACLLNNLSDTIGGDLYRVEDFEPYVEKKGTIVEMIKRVRDLEKEADRLREAINNTEC